VLIDQPFSGALDLPTSTRPAAFMRRTTSVSKSATTSLRKEQALVFGAPVQDEASSFSKNGTPAKGAFLSTISAATRAMSYRRWITAFSAGLSRSIVMMAASTSSAGATSPHFTSAARSSASDSA
jgi:hypothetical protein